MSITKKNVTNQII